MKIKELIIGALLFFIGQAMAWYQTNGQFISSWVKEHPLIVSAIVGMPIGMLYIYGTTYLVESSGGLLWPARMVGFATGIISFTLLTSIHMGEGINLKTGIILGLATIIVLIQAFWK